MLETVEHYLAPTSKRSDKIDGVKKHTVCPYCMSSFRHDHGFRGRYFTVSDAHDSLTVLTVISSSLFSEINSVIISRGLSTCGGSDLVVHKPNFSPSIRS